MTRTAGRAVLDADISEEAFQQTVRAYAKLRGWRTYHTRNSRGSDKGFPDLFMVRGRRQVLAELKAERRGLTGDQRDWLCDLRGVPGNEVYVWRPRDWDAIEEVLE